MMQIKDTGFYVSLNIDYTAGDLGAAHGLCGSEKYAYRGTLEPSPDSCGPSEGLGSEDGTSNEVAIKSFFTFQASDSSGTQAQYSAKRKVKQIKDCILEGNTLRFTAALLALGEAAIERAKKSGNKPPSELPYLPPVVYSGIAIDMNERSQEEEEGGGSQVNLVEELLSKFRKFLPTQVSEAPLDLTDEDYNLAQLFSALQHVQYVETHGLAFVSDFQGNEKCLTDLKVLVDP